MYIHKKESEVNITEFPVAEELHERDEYTLGDAHGNALYIFHFLLSKNIVKTSQTNFNEFVAIYLRHKKNIENLLFYNQDSYRNAVIKDVIDFIEVLKRVTVNKKAVLLKILLRLIGDELADRGVDDIFVIFLLEVLVENKIDFEIMFSNHGLEFLRSYLSHVYTQGLGFGQSDSMINLSVLLKYEVISIKLVEAIYEKIYFTRLKIISYTEDPTHPEFLIIYTHAPVPWRVIEDCCKVINIPYDEDNLPHTIDIINTHFRQIIKDKSQLHKYFPTTGNIAYNPLYPFDALIWCRLEDDIAEQNISRPHVIRNKRVYYVHGHHNKGIVPSSKANYVFNLDGMLGMYDIVTGKYAAFEYSPVPNNTKDPGSPTNSQPDTSEQNSSYLQLLSHRIEELRTIYKFKVELSGSTQQSPSAIEDMITLKQLPLPYISVPSIVSTLPNHQALTITFQPDQALLNSEGVNPTDGITIFILQSYFKLAIEEINGFLESIFKATRRPINFVIDHCQYYELQLYKHQIQELTLSDNSLIRQTETMTFLRQLKNLYSLTFMDINFKNILYIQEFMTDIGRLCNENNINLHRLILNNTKVKESDLIGFFKEAAQEYFTLTELDLMGETTLFASNIIPLLNLIKTNKSIKILKLPDLDQNAREEIHRTIDQYNCTITLCEFQEEINNVRVYYNRNQDHDITLAINDLQKKWQLFFELLTNMKSHLPNGIENIQILPQILSQFRLANPLISINGASTPTNAVETILLLFKYFKELGNNSNILNEEFKQISNPTFNFDKRVLCADLLQIYYDLLCHYLASAPWNEIIFDQPNELKESLTVLAFFLASEEKLFLVARLLYKRYLLSFLTTEPANETLKMDSLFTHLNYLASDFQDYQILGLCSSLCLFKNSYILTNNQSVDIHFITELCFKCINVMLTKTQNLMPRLIFNIEIIDARIISMKEKEKLIFMCRQYYLNCCLRTDEEALHSLAYKDYLRYELETGSVFSLDNDFSIKLNFMGQVINSTAFAAFIKKYKGMVDWDLFCEESLNYNLFREDADVKAAYYYQFITTWVKHYTTLLSSLSVTDQTLNHFLLILFDKANIFSIQLTKFPCLNREKFNLCYFDLLHSILSNLAEANNFELAMDKISIAISLGIITHKQSTQFTEKLNLLYLGFLFHKVKEIITSSSLEGGRNAINFIKDQLKRRRVLVEQTIDSFDNKDIYWDNINDCILAIMTMYLRSPTEISLSHATHYCEQLLLLLVKAHNNPHMGRIKLAMLKLETLVALFLFDNKQFYRLKMFIYNIPDLKTLFTSVKNIKKENSGSFSMFFNENFLNKILAIQKKILECDPNLSDNTNELSL